MRLALAILILIHGLIHFMGFAKAFKLADINQLSQSISKPFGMLWLIASAMFTFAVALFLLKNNWWSILAIIALVLSQTLIILFWNDAKFGTIANILILIFAIIGMATSNFEINYKKNVSDAIKSTNFTKEIITQNDLDSLPPIIQKYLNYVSLVGKQKVKNVKIVFEGEMRDKGEEWFSFTSEQYNFFDSPTRLFFMKAKVKGLPVSGYHAYKEEGASMLVKLLSLFPVVDIKGKEMFPTETVTYFNDLCLLAPAALIDKRIQWKTIDDLSVKAIFTTNGTQISAILYFNETGQLVNFSSNDRYSVSEMKAFPFSTPAKKYRNVNGYNLPTYGEAIWHYPDGEFVYGKFNLKSIEYNIQH